MEKMKVIVFEILPTVGKTLNKLLKSIPWVDLIDHDVNNTEEALDFIITQQPDVIILGNDFPGIDLYYFTQIIRKEAAPTQVIMIAEVVSAESVRLAMRAGAFDFICYKNLTVEELSLALEYAGQLVDEERNIRITAKEKKEPASQQQVKPHTKKPTRIITVYSPKGGAGVSTITANLAWSLSSNGLKVLVVDGDFLFGDMGVLLNQQSNHSIMDFIRFEEHLDEEVIQEVINHGIVDLLAAPSNVEKSVEINGPAFEKILIKLSQLDYDFLLINTCSHPLDQIIVALELAETIILVGTQEISSIRALGLFLDLIGTLSISREKLAVVINRFDKGSILTSDKFNEHLKIDISHTIPQDYGTVLLANNLGIPFVVNHKDLPISRSIESLANILIKGKSQDKSTAISKVFKNIKYSLSTVFNNTKSSSLTTKP
jgi:pilus assembly protein CpaE